MELLLVFSVCLLLGAADGQGPTVTTVHVKEDSDASLPCSIPENLEKKFFAWKKDGQTKEVFLYDAGRAEPVDGRVSHYDSGLQSGNASIVIRGAKLTDAGRYSCFYTINKDLKSRVELIVGTCPKPSAKQIDETEGWRLLQCVVQGAFPEPEVEWKDSSGHIIPAENPQVTEKDGRFDIILRTKVHKTDNYSCVVTQRELCHQIPEEVPVKFLDQTNIKLIIGLSAGVFVGLFAGVFVGIFVGRSGKVCRGSSGDKSYQAAEKDPESVNTPDPV